MEPRSRFPLRLSTAMREQVQFMARAEETSANQLIVSAIAQRLARVLLTPGGQSVGARLKQRDIDVVDGDLLISVPGDGTFLLEQNEVLRLAIEKGLLLQDGNARRSTVRKH
jgi:hypothetical protein